MRYYIVASLAAVVLQADGFASGSSPARAPRPPAAAGGSAQAAPTDDSRYALGKAVFSRKAAFTENRGAAKEQRTRLESLAASAGKSGEHLPALAGRLSAAQLDALEYYVARRFGSR